MAVRSISHESMDSKVNPPSSPSILRRLSVIAQGRRPRINSLPHQTFAPRFDLDELEGTYELYAELPGAKKERISVKTVDRYNIEVYGNVVRHSVETPRAELVRSSSNEPTDSFVKIWTPELASPSSPLSAANSRHDSIPTNILEEEDEEDGGILTKTHGRAYIYAEADSELRRKEEAVEDPYQVKHLITECQYGDFYRKFRFAQPIETSSITARFEDGVLHVTIPKGE